MLNRGFVLAQCSVVQAGQVSVYHNPDCIAGPITLISPAASTEVPLAGGSVWLNPTMPGAVGSPVILDTLWLKDNTKVPLLLGLTAHAFDTSPGFFLPGTSASSVSPASLQFPLHPLSL